MAEPEQLKEPAMNRVNDNIYAASAFRYLKEGKLDEASSLMQYAYAKRDQNGNYQVDSLGAIALLDFLRAGGQSGIGQRIQVDAKKFNEGLEELTVREMGGSMVGRLGLGKAVLEKVMKDGNDNKIQEIHKKLKDLEYEQNQLGAKYEKAIKEADDKDKKGKLAKEYQEKQKELQDKYKRELRLSHAISAALRISTDRVGSDALIFGAYSEAKSSDEIEEMTENASPEHKAEELY
ncbi:hypothetical protein J4429_01800 [Candidatus Pacearchaeota archaeon]|nr:hypothetical protein [Candidatus Pacearchaeota archaeon]